MRVHRSIALASILGLLVVGCGGTGQPSSPAPSPVVPAVARPSTTTPAAAATAAAALAVPASMMGTWTTDVDRPGPTNGTWTLLVTKDRFALKNPMAEAGDFFDVDVYAISDHDLLVDKGEEDCLAGRYLWSVDGGKMTLREATDNCGDRRIILTSGPWTKQP